MMMDRATRQRTSKADLLFFLKIALILHRESGFRTKVNSEKPKFDAPVSSLDA